MRGPGVVAGGRRAGEEEPSMPRGALDRKALRPLVLWLGVPRSPTFSGRERRHPSHMETHWGAPPPAPGSHPTTQTTAPGRARPGEKEREVPWQVGPGRSNPWPKRGCGYPISHASHSEGRASPAALRAPQHHSHAQGWVPGTRLQGPRPVAGSASPLWDHTAGRGPGAGREGSLLSCRMSCAVSRLRPQIHTHNTSLDPPPTPL